MQARRNEESDFGDSEQVQGMRRSLDGKHSHQPNDLEKEIHQTGILPNVFTQAHL